MKLSPVIVGVAVLAVATHFASAQNPTPLRSYAVSGTETTRTYNVATGWTEATHTYTGHFDLVTLTDAQLTKVYDDHSEVVRDLILHWTVDLNAPTQGGTAAELPDPNDPIIERTVYSIGLQYDGVRYTMSASFTTRAYLTIAGRTDWWNVGYGSFSGFVVSPLGTYTVSGSEQSGKTSLSYSGFLTLSSPSSGQLVRSYSNGATSTVTLAFLTAIDVEAAGQKLQAVQLENPNGTTTTYTLILTLNGTLYDVDASYETVSTKGRTSKITTIGAFSGSQP